MFDFSTFARKPKTFQLNASASNLLFFDTQAAVTTATTATSTNPDRQNFPEHTVL